MWTSACHLGALATLTTGTGALAGERRPPTSLSIPAGPLANGLRLLAERTDSQILFEPSLTAGKHGREVRNARTLDQALTQLLKASGLLAQRRGGTIIIVAAAAAPPPAAFTPDDIVVTALRRATRLDDTEISLDAIAGTRLTPRGAYDLRTLQRLLPGLSVLPSGGLQQRLSVRGVSGTGEATVAVYYGETPVAGPSGTTFDPGAASPDADLVDVERVELLNGPQGTLYGASSMGGTLRVIFAPAELGVASARLEGGVAVTEGGKAGGNAVAVANVPLTAGTLSARLVGYRRRVGGYIENTRLSLHDLGTIDRDGARLALAWAPTPGIRADAMLLHQDTRSDDFGNWYPAQGRYRSDTATRAINRDRIDLASLTVHADAGGAVLLGTASSYRWRKVRNQDYSNVLALQKGSARACARYSGDDAACTSAELTAFDAYVDQRLPALLHQPMTVRSVSAELRAASPSGTDRRLTWTIGAFAERRHDRVDSYVARTDGATGLPLDGADLTGWRQISTALEQRAVFAEATQRLGTRLSMTLGGRYYHYRRSASGQVIVPNVITGTAALDNRRYKGSDAGSNLKAELAYRPRGGVLAYVLASEGFRPGGVNITPALSEAERTYDADHLWNYEAGLKVAPSSGAVSLQAALFHIDWRDTIFNVSSSNGAFAYNTNLGRVVIDGAEGHAQLSIRPVRIGVRASYADPRLAADAPGLTADGMGERGDRLPNVPRLSYALSLDADLNVPSAARAFAVGLQVSGNSGASTTFNTASPYHERTPSRVEVGAHLDRRIGGWQLGLLVENVFDATLPIRVNSSAFGKQQLYTGRPRTVTFTVSRVL